MGIQEAIAAPRIHIEGCDPKVPEGNLIKDLFIDPRISPTVVKALERRGHTIRLQLDGDFALPVGNHEKRGDWPVAWRGNCPGTSDWDRI